MFVPSDVSIYNVTEPTVTTGSSLPLLGIFVSLGNQAVTPSPGLCIFGLMFLTLQGRYTTWYLIYACMIS